MEINQTVEGRRGVWPAAAVSATNRSGLIRLWAAGAARCCRGEPGVAIRLANMSYWLHGRVTRSLSVAHSLNYSIRRRFVNSSIRQSINLVERSMPIPLSLQLLFTLFLSLSLYFSFSLLSAHRKTPSSIKLHIFISPFHHFPHSTVFPFNQSSIAFLYTLFLSPFLIAFSSLLSFLAITLLTILSLAVL